MLIRERRHRPDSWAIHRGRLQHSWTVPFFAIEWVWEWVAFGLANWTFLEVLEYLGSLSVLVAVILFFHESGDRIKQKHYQAWQVINTAQGKGGSGGRIEALQELNSDKVPLVGVDVAGAFLQGIDLRGARLLRSNFIAADVRNSNFESADFMDADLTSANFRDSNLRRVSFRATQLGDADLSGADLAEADLTEASLTKADLRNADLSGIHWQQIKSVKMTNLAGVKNSPEGFLIWAIQNGAIQPKSGPE